MRGKAGKRERKIISPCKGNIILFNMLEVLWWHEKNLFFPPFHMYLRFISFCSFHLILLPYIHRQIWIYMLCIYTIVRHIYRNSMNFLGYHIFCSAIFLLSSFHNRLRYVRTYKLLITALYLSYISYNIWARAIHVS